MTVPPKQLDGSSLGSVSVSSVAISANVTTVAVSSAASSVLMTLPPFAASDGNYLIELFSPGVTKGTTTVSLELWLNAVFNQSICSLLVNAVAINPFSWRGLVALATGGQSLTVRGFVDAGTGTLTAGTGATGAQPNAVLTARAA